MQALTQKTDGSPYLSPITSGRESAGIDSERELKMLSLKFVGIADGKYCFRQPDKPLDLIVMTQNDYRIWELLQRRYSIIDSDIIDAVILLGKKAEALEPGFDARAWLEARGL
jgi:hypothetical protein